MFRLLQRTGRLFAFTSFAFACLTTAASAAGETSSLVLDMGIAIMVAGFLAIIFTRLKVPTIAAFLLAGFVVGPLGLKLVTDPVNIDTIAQIGFVLLLFMIGLELDVRSLLKSGKALILVGLAQYPLTLLFGYLVTQLLLALGFGGLIAESPLTPIYIGVVIAGSSTIQVVQLFQQRFELDTQPGRIAITLLIFQDLWAIVAILLQPNISNPQVAPILFSFAGILILLLIAVLIARVLISRFFHWISKSPEIIVLGALSWCFALVFLGTQIDHITELFGFNFHMAVGSGISALIAGATIANMPFSIEITTKVGILKDFFVTLFFVGLGISVPAITGWEVPLIAIFLAVIAIAARQLIFFPMLYIFGVDARNAEVSSVRLAQISEFGLVIVFLGVSSGQVSPELSSAVILAFVITALATTPMFDAAYAIYERMRVPLGKVGFKEPAVKDTDEEKRFEIAFLGLHRDASSLLHELKTSKPEILSKVLVVDFNVALHPKIREMGVEVEYGDISNTETLIHAGIDKAKIIICTISDDLLRGINNRDLVRSVRALCPEAIIISNAVDIESYQAILDAGADYVYMARIEVAAALNEILDHTMNGQLKDYVNRQSEQRVHPSERKEVLG